MESMVWLTLNLRDSSWAMGRLVDVEAESMDESCHRAKCNREHADEFQTRSSPRHGLRDRVPSSPPYLSVSFFLLYFSLAQELG